MGRTTWAGFMDTWLSARFSFFWQIVEEPSFSEDHRKHLMAWILMICHTQANSLPCEEYKQTHPQRQGQVTKPEQRHCRDIAPESWCFHMKIVYSPGIRRRAACLFSNISKGMKCVWGMGNQGLFTLWGSGIAANEASLGFSTGVRMDVFHREIIFRGHNKQTYQKISVLESTMHGRCCWCFFFCT